MAFACPDLAFRSCHPSKWSPNSEKSHPRCSRKRKPDTNVAIVMHQETSSPVDGDWTMGVGGDSSRIRYKMRVSYDGTKYHGWQFQPRIRTVQGELERHIGKKFNHKPRVVGASRTDAGVHALGQMAHFDVPTGDQIADIEMFEFTLNRMLPGDIRVSLVEEATRLHRLHEYDVSENQGDRPWHAIFSATKKLYSYRFSIAKELNPMERLYRYHEYRGRKAFDINRMLEAAKHFVGSHDFTSFTNSCPPPPGKEPAVLWNPVRKVNSVKVIDEGMGRYRIEYELIGALYKMVRNMTGAVLNVGCGKLTPDDIVEILHAKNRKQAPKSAPAQGLQLDYVYYDS